MIIGYCSQLPQPLSVLSNRKPNLAPCLPVTRVVHSKASNENGHTVESLPWPGNQHPMCTLQGTSPSQAQVVAPVNGGSASLHLGPTDQWCCKRPAWHNSTSKCCTATVYRTPWPFTAEQTTIHDGTADTMLPTNTHTQECHAVHHDQWITNPHL